MNTKPRKPQNAKAPAKASRVPPRARRKPATTGAKSVRSSLGPRARRPRQPVAGLEHKLEQAALVADIQSEIELSRDAYANLFDFAPVGYLELDRRGIICRINLTAARLLGRHREHLVRRPLLPLIAPPDRRSYLNHLSRLRRGEPEVTTELQVVPRNGSPLPVQLTSVPVPTDTNRGEWFHTAVVDLTERKQAEAKLAAAHVEVLNERNRLAAVMERLPVGVAILDAQGGNIQANPEFERVWGGPRPLPRTIQDYTVYQAWWVDGGRPVEPAEWASARAIQHGETVVGQEMEIQRFDGRRAYVLNSAAPIHDAEGRIIGTAVVIQDITVRKQAAEALRKSEEQLRLVLEYGNDAVFWADTTTGKILRCNRKAEELTGRSRAELVGMDQAGLHPPDRDYAEVFRRAASATATANVQAEVVSRTGRRIPVVINCSVVSFGSQRVIQGVFRDVTAERKAAAELEEARLGLERRVRERTKELRDANQRLRHEIEVRREKERELLEAHNRYRTVADFTSDWEYWRTPDGALQYCSPCCLQVTGYSDAELAADPGLLDRLVFPEDLDLWRGHSCVAGTAEGPRTILFRIRRKDGQVRWIEHSCQRVAGAGGESLGVRAGNRDVTDRKQAEMETQQLRNELARVSRVTAAGQLAAAMAHELSQPLGAIVCNAQAARPYLDEQPCAVGQVREIIGDIEADGKRAGDVIRRLRALFQRGEQDRESLQLNRVIQETVRLLNSEFLLKAVKVDLELDPALPMVLGSYVQLQQVLINLVMNAMEAMAGQNPGNRSLRIATTLLEPGMIRASLQDSGTGLPAEQMGRLGEPFMTTKPNGMGMGLAVSRSIIESHGGRLSAENNPGGGATFHFTLPVQTENPGVVGDS